MEGTKTSFIKEWWEYNDVVTLITRPRRFGKTLNLDMVEHFFSVNYSGSNLFCNLSIWQEEKYRKLQGTYPVISLSFANVKETSFLNTKKKICQIIEKLYNKYDFLLDVGSEKARKYVWDYYGWDEETAEKEEYTVETLKERVRELERKLFYLEEFIGQKGLWEESHKYIEEYRGEPIPFEIK